MTTWLRMAIIVMTVGGGFTGMVMSSQFLVMNPSSLTRAQLAILVGFTGMYAFVVVAGLLFVHNPQRLVPVTVAFTLQLPFVSSPVVSYRFTAGFHTTVGIVGGNLAAAFRLGSDFQFTLVQPLPWGFGINLVAVVFLILIAWPRLRPMPPAAPAPWTGPYS